MAPAHRDLWVELNENHAMAASPHGATLTSANRATTPADATYCCPGLHERIDASKIVSQQIEPALQPDDPILPAPASGSADRRHRPVGAAGQCGGSSVLGTGTLQGHGPMPE